MIKSPSARERVLSTLAKYGPLRQEDIAGITGIPERRVSDSIRICLERGHVEIQGELIFYTEHNFFGPRIEAKDRGPGNMIFDICKRNWQGYRVHKLFNSANTKSLGAAG